MPAGTVTSFMLCTSQTNPLIQDMLFVQTVSTSLFPEMKPKAVRQAYHGHVCVDVLEFNSSNIKAVMGPNHRGEARYLFAERQSWILLTSLPTMQLLCTPDHLNA